MMKKRQQQKYMDDIDMKISKYGRNKSTKKKKKTKCAIFIFTTIYKIIIKYYLH